MDTQKASHEDHEKTIIRTGISLPKTLLAKFDSMLEGTRYTSRSNAIRDAMGKWMAELEGLTAGKEMKVGALMVLYNHTKGAADALTELQHHFTETIISSIHVHLDIKKCLEIIVVRGRGEKVKKLSSKIIGGKGIEEVKSLLITPQ